MSDELTDTPRQPPVEVAVPSREGNDPEPIGGAAHMDTVRGYVGTVEVGDNYGPEVERFLGHVGLNAGYAWCAAFASYCLDAPGPDVVRLPEVRSALASDFITRRSMKASHVMTGIEQPEVGDLVIWKRGNGIFGHIGFVTDWNRDCGETVEGNAVDPDTGAEGVWELERCIEPGNYFRIVSFTEVAYEF